MKVHITTRVDDKTTEFEKEIDDPFVRHDTYVVWQPTKWLPWPKIRTKVTVIIGGDVEALQRWFGKPTRVNR